MNKIMMFPKPKSTQSKSKNSSFTGLELFWEEGGPLTSRVHGSVLTQTILPHFSFIGLKKGNQKQNKDVEDKQYEKRQW